nr:tripartite tricarboxylate transporter substrate binding protein [Bordetella sp. LUAb4]
MLIVVGSTFPLAAMSTDVEIEVYPKRPITLVVGFAPGDAADVVARQLALQMSEDLGQKVVVTNRPGAAGNIGAASVAKAEPDGYTIFMAVRPVALHKVMYQQVAYDFSADLVPVGMVVRVPYVLVMGKHVDATTLREAIALTGENPGKYTCASGGLGSTNHLICEALKDKAGMPWVHVPYSGSAAALTDVLGGRADFAVAAVTAALPHIAAESVRPLAVFSDGRVPTISNVPNIDEFGFAEISAHGWCALVAPTGTPSHAITRLNRSLNTALANVEIRKKLVRLGYVLPSPANTPEALEGFLKEDTETWTDVLREVQTRALQ